jgi:peptidoglycan-associated lipoprotein
MKRYYQVVLLVVLGAVVMSLSAAPATAVDGVEDALYSGWTTNLGTGVYFYEGDEEVQSGIIIEAKAGYDFDPRWTLETSVGYLPYLNGNRYEHPESRNFVLWRDTWGMRGAVDMLYHLNEDRGAGEWDTFLAAGGGVNYYSANLENDQHWDPFLNAGFGASYQWDKNWLVRGDYRTVMAGHDTEVNHLALLSLGYRWECPDSLGTLVRSAGGQKLGTIYFPFDSSQLTGTAQEQLRRNADWLAKNPKEAVVVEGHADERGTNEYNLALGSRRAASAQDYLRSLGVESARMRTVSYGEEAPAVQGHNEAAWAKNRRVETVVGK